MSPARELSHKDTGQAAWTGVTARSIDYDGLDMDAHINYNGSEQAGNAYSADGGTLSVYPAVQQMIGVILWDLWNLFCIFFSFWINVMILNHAFNQSRI